MTNAVYRLKNDLYHPTEWAGSPWSIESQHGGPVNALMARAVEAASKQSGLQPVRLVVDLLGPVPVKALRLDWTMPFRSRRTAQVDATLHQDGKCVARASALLLAVAQPGSAATLWPALDAPLPPPDTLEGMPLLPRSFQGIAPPGFHTSLELRMVPERLAGWLTTPLDLVEHEPITDFERAAALADLAGGLTGRMGSAPDTSDADAPLPRARFINTDTQLHLTRMPKGSWVGLEKILLADLDGIGNAAVRICDEQGPFGTALQSLLAR